MRRPTTTGAARILTLGPPSRATDGAESALDEMAERMRTVAMEDFKGAIRSIEAANFSLAAAFEKAAAVSLE